MKVRAAVASADSVMSPTGAGGRPKTNWAARDETKGRDIPLAANGLGISLMGNVEDAQVTTNIWIYSVEGTAEWVASVIWTVGSREVVEDPTTGETSSYLYADTAAFVDQEWPDDKIRLYDNDANEGLAQVKFDAEGAAFIKIEIASIAGGLTVIPIFRYW